MRKVNSFIVTEKLFVLFAFMLLLPWVYAQTAPAPQSASPTIVSNADEVTVDMVVHDNKNKPVLDLKAEDIAVTDSGSAVKISDLRLVTGRAGTQHLITLVFDRLDPSSAKNAHDIASKILKMIPADQFSFSVLKVEGRLRLVQGFTSDVSAVEKAVSAATEPTDSTRASATKEDPAALPEKNLIAAAQTGTDSSGAHVNTEQRSVARTMLASLEESQKIVQDQHCRPWLAGLLALARTQQQFPGRKVVIFFEQAPPLDTNAKDMLLTIAGAANRSGVSIYAVYANAVDEQAGQGLLATVAIGGVMSSVRMNPTPTTTGSGAGTQALPQAPPGSIVAGNDSLNQIELEGLSGYKNPLAELAESTGGAYITASDRLKKPLLQMIEDMTTYYEASYIPPVQQYDGKFRPVAVTPVRKHLKIHAKAGYFAVPPDAGSGIRPFEAPLLKLLSESQLPTDLKFHSTVLRLGDLPTGNENALVVEVPVDELETRDDPNANLYSLHVSIVAQVKNQAGEVIEHFSEDVPRHGALDSKGTAQSELITLQRHFTAEPGKYTLETAILDRNSEKAGAHRQEFEIPGQAAGPALSDVTLVQRVDPLPSELESTEPLQYGNGKVIPSLSGLVPHGTKNISFFFMVHPDPSSTEQPTLEMEVLKSNEPIAQVPLHLLKISGPGSLPYLASIQSSSLPSGEYEVIEKLTQGGKTAERGLTFRIEGPELASASAPDGATGAAQPQNDASELATSGQPPETDARNGRHLVITALPAGAIPPPSAEELETIVGGARKRALDYSMSLPNFMCVEVTSRSVDQSGNGNWKHRDSIAELLTYHDKQESRSTLEVNGKRSSLKRAEMNSTWPMSIGEFGALLNLVFAPSSKTQFEWKEAGTLGDGSGTLQVLSYRVAKENATLDLSEGNNSRVGVGFHGLVYIDAATSGVRRITVEADGLPRAFSMHAATMSVDYDYVTIAGRDYLLPVHSTVSLQRHRRQIELNEITFRNYRRFASRAKIKMVQ
ncbi:MAG: VWA domain-containing protein [Candidatus Sulfotelmatobacter sp.]|jgi:VWFA-related protein